MAFVTVNDLRLYYESRGTGHPVVVVPGLGADCRLFETLAAELARFHRVIVFDPRGSGRSDKPQGPYSIDQMAADLRDLIVALHLGVPDIVGYSMGGRTALAFAASHPQDVRRLVLVATSARVAPPRAFSARWFALNIVARIPTPSRLDPQPRSAFESQRRASSEFDGRALLSRIEAPTLIVRAKKDRMTPKELVDELRLIPGSQHVVLDGGHMSLLILHSRDLAATVSSFLAQGAS